MATILVANAATLYAMGAGGFECPSDTELLEIGVDHTSGGAMETVVLTHNGTEAVVTLPVVVDVKGMDVTGWDVVGKVGNSYTLLARVGACPFGFVSRTLGVARVSKESLTLAGA